MSPSHNFPQDALHTPPQYQLSLDTMVGETRLELVLGVEHGTISIPEEKEPVVRTIGDLAASYAIVGEEKTASQLAVDLIVQTGIDTEAEISVWERLSATGSKQATERLRLLLGIAHTASHDGEEASITIVDRGLKDEVLYSGLSALYAAGDTSVLPLMRKMLSKTPDSMLSYEGALRHAIGLFESGDEESFNIILTIAQRARNLALKTHPDEVEIGDNTHVRTKPSSSIESLRQSLRSEFTGLEEAMEGIDEELVYLAKNLLRKKDVIKADNLQRLLTISSYTTYVNALRYAYGQDPTGSYHAAVKDYLRIFGGTINQNTKRMIRDALVIGGDEEITNEYLAVSSLEGIEDIDDFLICEMISVLFEAGKLDADEVKERLNAVSERDSSARQSNRKLLSFWLREIGLSDDANIVVAQRFEEEKSAENAQALLRRAYNDEAFEIAYRGETGSLLEKIGRRALLLTLYAEHMKSTLGQTAK